MKLAALLLKLPIHLYRWTLRPYVGWQCRHLPTCSEYALESIDKNGAWRGFWLTISRLARCWPWGTAGYDPVPDLKHTYFPLRPWRYGRWTGAHIDKPWAEATETLDTTKNQSDREDETDQRS